jgi:ATP-binding cassette subfamily B protein
VNDFPFFKQVNVMDCGPACLQMVAKYYGKDYSLSMLSNLCGLSSKGATLLGMSEAAQNIGFNTRSVKVTLEEIREKELFPCVAHWRKKHFIVIYKVTEDKIFVADPANGLLEYPKDEFIEKWAIPGDEAMRGIVLLLELK